jgi:hypothetical protein
MLISYVPAIAIGELIPENGFFSRYFREVGIENVVLLSADGALEAAPAMGAADIILDLVSTGVTLRENNLKQIKGGDILEVRSWNSVNTQICSSSNHLGRPRDLYSSVLEVPGCPDLHHSRQSILQCFAAPVQT